MREPQLAQQLNHDKGQGQTAGTNPPLGVAPVDPTTTISPHQQLTTTIDLVLHIAPLDASDVRKEKKPPSKPTLSIDLRARTERLPHH